MTSRRPYIKHPDFVSEFPKDTPEYHRGYRNHIMRCHPELYDTRKEKARSRNRGNYTSRLRGDRRTRKEWIVLLKGGKCQACGIEYDGTNLTIFDFHHLYNKYDHMARMFKASVSDEHLIEESKKCVLLCSNCHRLLHYENSKNITAGIVSDLGLAAFTDIGITDSIDSGVAE